MSAWNNMDSTQGEGGFLDNTQAFDGEDKSDLKRGQNCVPVMIAHLNRCGEELTLWGMPVKMIAVVAIVRQIEQVTTKVSYELEDETGA